MPPPEKRRDLQPDRWGEEQDRSYENGHRLVTPSPVADRRDSDVTRGQSEKSAVDARSGDVQILRQGVCECQSEKKYHGVAHPSQSETGLVPSGTSP